uniref:Large ribosomal subunit protein uL23c n=1 Tax=Jenufa minuta TaxID=993092 RepID=A0A0S2LNL5_JENMI|nr:ribosomal protein L23 [Jenufa minuta]ALO62975.1 ribosomal protein L23 [Jenufa minuta]
MKQNKKNKYNKENRLFFDYKDLKNSYQVDNLDRYINLIKSPVMTEKSSQMLLKNQQYTFDVDVRLTKPQLKILFSKLFNVLVYSVNTHRLPPKKTRFSKTIKPKYKRAIITLKGDSSVSLLTTKNVNA